MALIVSPIVGKKPTNSLWVMLDILELKFDKRKSRALVGYFSASTQKLEECDWESSLIQAGKFVEVVVKTLWVFAGKTLPKAKDFKASIYAQKIINQVSTSELPSDGIRLQVPRACVFVYDIASNRGGRHDSDEFNPNEMDAFTTSVICSWILSELVRFCAPKNLSPHEARKLVESIIKRRYPVFEKIEGRIYIDKEKHKSALQCALLILYIQFPKRMHRDNLSKAVERHGYGKSALRFGRLSPFVDSDAQGDMLLRLSGRKKAEYILSKRPPK